MAGFGIANGRLGKLNAFQEQKRNVAELANVNNPVPEKIAYADRPKAVQDTTTLANAADKPSPSLNKMTWKNTGIVPMAGQGEYRTEALRDMNEAEFAQNQEKMNATGKEYWMEQIKAHPESSYAYLNYMLAEDETPEEKRKRERREALGETFRGLGNLIGNAANLYYTHRGGQYIDLNSVNEKHRERMQRIKDKQDALDEQRKQMLVNAKLGEIKAERAEKAAEKKLAADKAATQLKFKQDLYLKQLDNAYKMGQIDAQTKAKLAQDALKAKTDKELEAIKHSNRMTLKATPSYGEDDVVESFADTNGVVWTRTKPFSKAEKAEFFESLPTEIQQMFTVEQYDDDGSVKSRKVDYDGALGYAINQGYITNPEERGFKKGKSSGKKAKSLPGVNNKGTKSLPGVNK